MNSSNFKRLLFDSITFGYLFTLLLVASFQLYLGELEMESLLNLRLNTIVYVSFFILGGFLSFILNNQGIKTLGEILFEPPHKKVVNTNVPWYKTFWGMELGFAFIVTFIAGVQVTEFSIIELLDPDGFEGAVRLFTGIASPNFDILPRAILAIIETIFIAFMATVIAIPIAFVMSFFCAKNIMKHPAAFATYAVLRTILNITRSVEPLIWAIIFSVWVGIGPFAGMLALMLHSVASLAKQYSEIVECVDNGPIEGIQSCGANTFQVVWFAVVPQIVLPYISFTIYRWDINVRMATIIGLVGGGGIGTMLIQYQGQAQWKEVGCIILVIAAVVWIMDTASAYIREAIK